MAEFDPTALTTGARSFVTERHLATLHLTRPDGTPHVTPVGVTVDEACGLARVITWADSYKARLVAATPDMPVAICQVDGGRWLTIYGTATVSGSPEDTRPAVEAYAARYRQPTERDDRVVIEVRIDRITGRAPDPTDD